jgi:CPA1 family monovalent cation:H+ antiporter
MLQPVLPIIFALLAVMAFAALGARRTHIPDSIFLVLVGLAISFVPGMPRIALRPDLVLSLLLPPLLYRAGVNMSWRGFKANLWPILLLAVGLVVLTTLAVGGVAHWVLGLPLAVGFVLGAVVSPPDAVAPMAIARRYVLPGRVLTILEGEGLVNDATALILFSFAVAAVTQGVQFSAVSAIGEFLLIVAGEIGWGLFMGWGALALRRWAADPRVEMVFALLTPFAAFWVPESLGGSGVLATVICGLFISWNGPRYISPATRLQGFFVWDLVVYLVESVVFLLCGLQARIVADTLEWSEWGYLALACLAVCAVLVAVRFLWVFTATYLPRVLIPKLAQDPAPDWRNIFIIGFTGIRGVVSLAAALSIPIMADGAPFPQRGLLLLVTFAVILVTLVGQGLTLPWVIGLLGISEHGRREADAEKKREISARLASIDAALARLDSLEAAASAPETVAALRRRNEDRRAYFVAACQNLSDGGDATNASGQLQIQFVEAERQSIAAMYYRGEISDAARRRIERELDLEDSRIRHSAESGTIKAL